MASTPSRRVRISRRSPLIKRYLDDQGPPQGEYVTFERDRSGGTDYVKSDLAAIRNARVADLRKYYLMYTPPTPDVWLNEMREVVRWVERINARGGKVVFYREPVSGEHIELDEQNFPRDSTGTGSPPSCRRR